MKVIFLDVDGVLNRAFPRQTPIRPECVARLRRIIDATGARICLSSSWRHLEDWEELLFKAGVPRVFCGQTPYMNGTRGLEIEAWIDEHGTPESFVILDDYVLDMGKMSEYAVETNSGVGLTEADADEAIRVLMK